MASAWSIRDFVARQIAARTPHDAPPLTVSPRRLYILPTGAGLLFALLLIVMTLGATNYGNNLAFALTFWLAAVALVSMHRAHRNLSGLTLIEISGAPVFAGQSLSLNLTFSGRARRTRRRLLIAGDHLSSLVTDIEDRTTMTMTMPTTRRGRLPVPVLAIESRFPLGLFRCWTRLAPTADVLVYPRPQGDAHVPPIGNTGLPGNETPRPGDADFVGLRAYRDGDAARDIDWKHSARRPHLLVRERGADRAAPDLRFEYAALTHLDLEARLSQLALWVVEAAAADRRYTLCLPDGPIGPDQGLAHRRRCLEALAVFH